MRYFYVCLFVMLCASVSSCSQKQSSELTQKQEVVAKVPTNVKRIIIPAGVRFDRKHCTFARGQISYDKTLAQVMSTSDAIVIGKPTQSLETRAFSVEYLPQDPEDTSVVPDISSEWSVGNFQIEQVLYQKNGFNLSAGQMLQVAEAVGVTITQTAAYRSIVEDCYETKPNSRYVLFIGRGDNNVYVVDNFNLGRFNTDGTDTEDEMNAVAGLWESGGKTDKQKLREELTAAYGVTFAVPTTVAPSVTSLSPASAAPGSSTFPLTVTGANFKNGAVVKFGGADKPTTFLSAISLSAIIAASDIASAGAKPVLVTNPDGRVSASATFTVQAATNTLPAVTITSASTKPSVSTTYVFVNIGKAQTTGTRVQVEKQTGTTWSVIADVPASACNEAVNNPHSQVVALATLPDGTVLRARVVKGTETSAYSPTRPVSGTIPANQDPAGDFCGISGL